jgi:lipopolysaccharide transport system permease protein
MTNPHANYALGPLAMVRSLWRQRLLTMQLIRREVLGRYKGSALGLLWSFLNPIFLLLVYTFFFAVVFKARWTGNPGAAPVESKAQFAIVVFVGMIIHTFFSEVLIRAPMLVVSQPNFVKKIVFPLEILVPASVGAALFHAAISTLVLLLANAILIGQFQWTSLWFPVVLVPLVIAALGVGWIVAGLGVYLRDLSQTVGLLSMVLMFLSPVFYSVSSLPEPYQVWIMANPLTFIIEQGRNALIWGIQPHLKGLLLYTIIATGFAWMGYAWFQKIRKGFADVI